MNDTDELTPIATATELKIAAIRDGITRLLALCTEKQRTLVHHVHQYAPWKSLENCPPDKLDETYELLRRTAIKNRQEAKP